MSGSKSITFSVDGMSCDHCKRSLEEAVKSLAGVTGAAVDLEQNLVEITFDEKTVEKEALVEAIETAGYRVAR